MQFIVNYTCKEKYVHEAIFEPSPEDILIYFKEVNNLDMTLDQLKYLDLEKIESQENFSVWAYKYGSEKKQKQYDEFYKNNLEKATEELKLQFKKHKIIDDKMVEECRVNNFLPKKALSIIKNRVKKFEKEN